MSPFLVLPVAAVVSWLGHAGLGLAAHRAYPFTRWILFGGLTVTAVLFLLRDVQANKSVPTGWKNDSLAGVAEGVLALEAFLVLLGLALVEIVHVAVTGTIKDFLRRKRNWAADRGGTP